MPTDPRYPETAFRDEKTPQRLHKVLARAGVASRRGSEELIAQRRVCVNGRLVTEQGMQIDATKDVVTVDGARIAVDDRHATYMLNKPKGVITAMSDSRESCVGDMVRGREDLPAGLFHVGRLDADTTGLLLLSNDGELAHRLAHPSYQIPKTYLATVRGEVDKTALNSLRRGIILEDGPAQADVVTVKGKQRGRSIVEMTVHEGRNRIVRRMWENVGFPVVELARLRVGPITLGDLRWGELRALSASEVGSLWAAVEQKAVRS